MAKYRHPYVRSLQPDAFTRAPLPAWLQKPREHYNRNVNTVRGYDYWITLYWATPPWLSDEHVNQMKRIREKCPPGFHIDHEVPLKGPNVCGLNVPWNLVIVPAKENLVKHNRHWPDMPMQPMDLFDDHRYQPFQLQMQEAM